MANGVVAHADRASEAFFVELRERLPRFVAKARYRAVDQVQIDVVEGQLAATPFERSQRGLVSVVAVPELRCDENLVSWNSALPDRRADVPFVRVHFRGIDQATSDLQGGGDGRPCLLARRGLPHAEAQDRHLVSVVQGRTRFDGEAHRSERRRAPYFNLDARHSGLWNVFFRVHERLLHDACRPDAFRRRHPEPGPDLRVIDSHQGVPDVLLESWRVRHRGDVTHLPAVRMNIPVVRDPGSERFARDFDPHELPPHAFPLDPSNRCFAEIVRPLVLVNRPAQPDLIGTIVEHDVGTVVQDAGLNPTDLRRRNGPDLVLRSGGHDGVPELLPEFRVAKVQLVSAFRAPPGPGNDQGDAIEFRLRQVVVLKAEDLLAKEVHHDVLRLRALQLEWGHVRLAHADIEAGMDRDALAPEQHVPVGQGEPEVVLSESEQDRVVDDPAIGCRQKHVLALADRTLLHVPRRQELHELESIGAVDLDLSLDADVPQGHVVHEMPVLLHGIRIETGHQHVVVEVVCPNAVLRGATEVRRLLNPCRLPEPRENRTRVVVCGLCQHAFTYVVGYHTTS